jgi:hypothetical protein
MQVVLDHLNLVAGWAHLAFKPRKCGSLGIVKGKHCKSQFIIGKDNIPSLGLQESYKYLGTPQGFKVDQTPHELLETLVEQSKILFKSFLAPWQKIDAYLLFIYPRLQFLIRACRIPISSLAHFDNKVRPFLKAMIALPPNAANHYTYAEPSMGGLGILPVRDDYNIMTVIHGFKMLSCADPAVNTIAMFQLRAATSKFASIRQSNVNIQNCVDFLNNKIEGQSNTISNFWMDVRKSTIRLASDVGLKFVVGPQNSLQITFKIPFAAKLSLYNTNQCHLLSPKLHLAVKQFYTQQLGQHPVQGRVSRCMAHSRSYANSFFTRNGHYLSHADYKFVHRARLECLDTNVHLAYGNSNCNQTCRICGFAKETQTHVLNHCPTHLSSHGTTRHNCVVNNVAKAIPYSLGVLQLDQSIKQIFSSRRPDIVVLNRTKRTAHIVDVQIVYESSYVKFQEARAGKVRKYQYEVQQLQNLGYNVYINAIIVGSLGTWDKANESVLKALHISERLSKRLRKACTADCIHWSQVIWYTHRNHGKQQNQQQAALSQPLP